MLVLERPDAGCGLVGVRCLGEGAGWEQAGELWELVYAFFYAAAGYGAPWEQVEGDHAPGSAHVRHGGYADEEHVDGGGVRGDEVGFVIED